MRLLLNGRKEKSRGLKPAIAFLTFTLALAANDALVEEVRPFAELKAVIAAPPMLSEGSLQKVLPPMSSLPPASFISSAALAEVSR
jgi:hypothetical protein